MRVSESMFFTARPALSGTRAAKFAEEKYIFFSADPGGIGSAPEKHTSCFTGQAFHRAEEGRKEKDVRSGDTQKS